ncbi:MAG: glycine cleavage system transcriptional repressor [Planctomycetota bacterium]|jgi:glycine cleavage system regulatory protein
MPPSEQFGCLVALGDDRVGLVRDATEFLVEAGVNIRSIRSTTLGFEFALLAQFSGTSDQIHAVEIGVDGFCRKSGLSVLFHHSTKSEGHEPLNELTHDVFVSAYDSVGIVSTVTAALARHDVNIERLGGDRYPAPNQGQPLFTIVASVHLPDTTDENEVLSDLESLRDQHGWAEVELYRHGRFNLSSLAGAPPFPPRDQWTGHDSNS